MLKKRLIGVVTVRQGLAVQSFGYSRYMPLGKVEIIVENLNRWGADEILIQCIDRSKFRLGPDFNLLKRISSLGLSTPVIYGGGIRNVSDAVQVVNNGADRILLDAALWDSSNEIEFFSKALGSQALIANITITHRNGNLYWNNYRRDQIQLIETNFYEKNQLDCISEIMLTDMNNEGCNNSFDEKIIELFPSNEKSLILFGGLSEYNQIQRFLSKNNVVAVGVGNSLNYKEHALQKIKQNLKGIAMRTAQFNKSEK
jgi:cyclase